MAMMLKESAVLKEEKLSVERFTGEDEEGRDPRKVSNIISSDRSSIDLSPRSSSSNLEDTPTSKQEDQLESTKAEMGVVQEENKRLKLVLARIVKDYESLQTQFSSIIKQEVTKKPIETISTVVDNVDEPEFFSLRLGTSVSEQKKDERVSTHIIRDDEKMDNGLTLGLDSKFQTSSSCINDPASSSCINDPLSNTSPTNSSEGTKDEEMGEPWPPSKLLKNLRNREDEASLQSHVKKARVSVRARCDAPTMNDGCQWRKYGQKIAKGNPCPRAYYRCTVAPACPVRKQVQRCAEDMTILITTYEGNHNHPLPISANAMASTTSAAACMLMAGSSSSGPATGSPSSATTVTSSVSNAITNFNGLDFGLSNNLRSRQLFLPNPTISSNPSYPTITLDLTAPLSSTSQPSQFNRFSSPFNTNQIYPSTNFNFSSTESQVNPTSWGNGYLGYGTQPYNSTHVGALSMGRPSPDSFYKSYMQKASNAIHVAPSSQHSLTDTIAKAITADPSFQSALAAAITSYVGVQGKQVAEDGSNVGLKLGEQFNLMGPYIAAATQDRSNGCATTYLTRSTSASSNPQQGNMQFQQPPVALTKSKSTSSSPMDNMEKNN